MGVIVPTPPEPSDAACAVREPRMDRGPWCASQRCRACIVAGVALVIVDEGDEDDFGEAAAGFAWFLDAGFAEAVDDGEDDTSGVGG
jgi:hypothetical protein